VRAPGGQPGTRGEDVMTDERIVNDRVAALTSQGT